MTPRFAPDTADCLPLTVLEPEALPGWLEGQDAATRAWVEAAGFAAGIGEALALPGPDGAIRGALAGYGTAAQRRRGRFILAASAGALPPGAYRLEGELPGGADPEVEALGWLLGQYRFDRYRDQAPARAALCAPAGIDEERVLRWARGEMLTRDLINTPAADMGPDALEAAARELAQDQGAAITVTEGAALLEENFPLIHTVGRAAARAPRLIDLRWGDSGPRVTLVGKGVCFDTGGLNLKPGGNMGLMKKDMGGAATVLGLARMLMEAGLKIRLRVLVPAVENAVSGDAFRPGDILPSRKGLTVEVNNTDAEGRLVLADALALGAEESPELMVSMATLTGAARVAVGPDLAPFYSDDSALVGQLEEAGRALADPLWRMPFWEPYEAMIEPGIADLDNAPKGGFAGSITAALFLRRFAEGAQSYAHFDIYGWQPDAAPGRPKGGAGQGARALFQAICTLAEAA